MSIGEGVAGTGLYRSGELRLSAAATLEKPETAASMMGWKGFGALLFTAYLLMNAQGYASRRRHKK
jgi:hypothetical protein